MFKSLARWILRDEIAASKKQVSEQASHITSLCNETLRLTKIINAKDAWWRVCEMLTSPEAVAAVKQINEVRWDMALADLRRNVPGMPPIPERHLLELTQGAMLNAIKGLLEGADVEFIFSADPASTRVALRASIYVNRAQFHIARPVERARFS